MSETNAEAYVRELIFKKFGTVLRKLPGSKEHGVKTPDFELLDGETCVAVLEVKQIEYVSRTEKNGWEDVDTDIPGQSTSLIMKTRRDNGPERVGSDIHDAWKQLKGYNIPKILAFVNNEHGLDVVDLKEAWNGFLEYGTEETGYVVNVVSAKIANGRIKGEKGQIDLYIWFDRHYGEGTHVSSFQTSGVVHEVRTQGPYISLVTLAGYELARRYFGAPETEIPEDILKAPTGDVVGA